MNCDSFVLILVVVDNGLVLQQGLVNSYECWVLILVVVDNGLVQDIYDNINDYE